MQKYFVFPGPAIGSALYAAGGFGMPFWVVGGLGCVVAVCLYFMIPIVKGKGPDSSDGTTRSLTVKDIFMVNQFLTKFRLLDSMLIFFSVTNDIHPIPGYIHSIYRVWIHRWYVGTIHEGLCRCNSRPSWNCFLT